MVASHSESAGRPCSAPPAPDVGKELGYPARPRVLSQLLARTHLTRGGESVVNRLIRAIYWKGADRKSVV